MLRLEKELRQAKNPEIRKNRKTTKKYLGRNLWYFVQNLFKYSQQSSKTINSKGKLENSSTITFEVILGQKLKPPIDRIPRFTGYFSFPPSRPVNRGFTVITILL